jgi:methyl-accepting chemotaxis protein
MLTHFNNLAIGKKLFALAGVLLAFLAILGIVSIKNLSAVDELGASTYNDRVVPMDDLSAARAYLGDIDSQVLRVQVTGRDNRDYIATAKKDVKEIDALIGKYEATKLVEDEVKGLKAYHANWDKYQAAFSKIQQLAATGQHDQAASLYFAQAAPLYAAVDKNLADLSQTNSDVAKDLNEEITSTYDSSRTLTIALILLALGIGIAVAFFVTRAIKASVATILERLRSMQENDTASLRNGLDALAQGDLTAEAVATTEAIENPAKDELGQIAEAVNGIRQSTADSIDAYGAMAGNLRELIGSVSESAGSVSSASQQMASTSEEAGKAVGEIARAVSDVAQGAERQVRGVDSVKSSADEAATAARTSAEQAQEAAEVADQAREAAQEGVGAAEQANEAMQAVRGSSQSVTEVIRELAAKSEQIGAIVETITGIANQTNLLALNAAIEAARAGEQGRGFAVVAEEVRKLAEESQDAAGEIASLIETIQSETGKAVEVVEDGARRTDDGAAVVEQTREAFVRIGTAVEDVNERIGQIAGAAQQISAETSKMQGEIGEVAAVAEQSSAGAEEVSASTEQTSASTQEIAASAQELASTASELERLVGQFKVTA